MQTPSRALHQLEVIMKTTPPNEGTLMRTHNLWHLRCEAGGEHLSHQLGHAILVKNGVQ
jgi:hypothetical protein